MDIYSIGANWQQEKGRKMEARQKEIFAFNGKNGTVSLFEENGDAPTMVQILSPNGDLVIVHLLNNDGIIGVDIKSAETGKMSHICLTTGQIEIHLVNGMSVWSDVSDHDERCDSVTVATSDEPLMGNIQKFVRVSSIGKVSVDVDSSS